ncbi:MAG: stage V sporulation protein AC [Ruminococcaceae bacterium]|nr:stage V sporulation protein AC [Oscillospiraceae bacterium]
MATNKKQYDKMTKKASPPSPLLKNCFNAFWIGGVVCMIGEGFKMLYGYFKFNEDETKAAVTVTLIVITAILTGIGIFDRIAKVAGAGTIVPITGFANSVVSPAMEFKTEGSILGTAANIFKLAGPVILYSVAAAFVYGVVYYIAEKI